MNKHDADDAIDVTKSIAIDLVTGTPVGGWAHTHGMYKFSLPELEIRDVPEFLFEEAAHMLNMLASYMVNSSHKVYAGQHLQFSDLQRFALIEAVPLENAEHHYDYPRWTIVEPAECTCSRCSSKAESTDSIWQYHHEYMHAIRLALCKGQKNDLPN